MATGGLRAKTRLLCGFVLFLAASFVVARLTLTFGDVPSVSKPSIIETSKVVAEQTLASSCAMADLAERLPHSSPGKKVVKQVCGGPFGVSKIDKVRRLAIMLRGESFRGLKGMYDRSIDVDNKTFDCQNTASKSHVEQIIKPFEACGFTVDVFLKTWRAHDTKWRRNSSEQLIDMYGGRVVQAAFDEHKEFEKIGIVKTKEPPQVTNYVTGLEMISNYSRLTGVTWDALLIIRCDLIFKRPLGNLKYEKAMLAFPEWSLSPGGMVADTIHYFPWRFLNCAVKERFKEHYSGQLAQRVGEANFGFLVKQRHDANAMADWNPLYKMCRKEQRYDIDGGFALMMFTVDPVSKAQVKKHGESVRTSLITQASPRTMTAVDIVYHFWVHDPARQKEMGDALKFAFGKVPAAKEIEAFKATKNMSSDSGWETAAHSIRRNYFLLTHSVSFKERISSFHFDRYVFARMDYYFTQSFVSAYACQTDVMICIGFGAGRFKTIPVVIIASVKACVNFQKTSASLTHLVQDREPNATKFLEMAFGLPVKVLCQRC